MTRDEFVKFSRFIYGAGWPDYVASAVGTNRREIVKEINKSDNVPEELAELIIRLTEEKLAELQADLQKIKIDRGEEQKQPQNLPEQAMQSSRVVA